MPKVIKAVRSEKTGAYTFKEEMVPSPLVQETLKKIRRYPSLKHVYIPFGSYRKGFLRIFGSYSKNYGSIWFFFSSEKKESLDKGLEKSSKNLFSKLGKAIVGKSKVDDDILDELEEILITSDVGVDTTIKIIRRIEERVEREKYINTSELDLLLREEVAGLLEENNYPGSGRFLIFREGKKPLCDHGGWA